jgi:hypothetical protein
MNILPSHPLMQHSQFLLHNYRHRHLVCLAGNSMNRRLLIRRPTFQMLSMLCQLAL